MKLLVSVAKKLGLIAAVLIIIAAFFVCVSWVVSPVLHKHRADIETWVSHLLGLPVTIQQVDLSWYHYQPVISLNSVTLQNRETHQPVLQIKKVLVFFSIPQSVWHWQPMPSGILVSGADLNVKQSAKGEITVQGFPNLGGYNAAPYKQESDFKDMLGWLALPPRIILENIDIRYKGFTGPKRFITLYELSLINSKDDHVILGKAILHQTISTEVTVALRWLGTELDFSKIKAKLYLYVSGLSLDQWLTGSKWNGWEVKHGVVSSKIWANWHLGKFRKIQAILQFYNLSLFSAANKKTHYIDRLSGHLGWRENQATKEQELAGDDILIDFAQHLWPVTHFYISLLPDTIGTLIPKNINLGFVNLKDAQNLYFSSTNTYLPADIQAILLQLHLSGDIEHASLVWPGPLLNWYDASLTTQFKHISFLAHQKYPGIKNISGAFAWDGKKGDLKIASDHLELQYDRFYAHPLLIDQLLASVQLSEKPALANMAKPPINSLPPVLIANHNDDLKNIKTSFADKDWLVTIPSLQLLSNDLAVNLKGTLMLDQGNMLSDLSADMSLQQVKNIAHYLPLKIMDSDLVKWLQQAFLSGSLTSAKAVLKGALKDFPFEQGNGSFYVTGEVEDINLRYADDWPSLQHITGLLTFKGKEMLVAAPHAKILTIPLTNIKATIDDLTTDKSSILYVSCDPIQTDFVAALNFVKQSPLQKTLGKIFSGLHLVGSTTIKLQLTVPLKDPDKTAVQGELALANTELNLVPWNLSLKNVNGLLNFTENTTVGNHIQAELFNKPISFNLATLASANVDPVIEASSTMSLAVSDFENWLKIPFSKIATGSTIADVKIDLSLHKPLEIYLHSNLEGLALNLNKQFAKHQDEARAFSATIIAEAAAPLQIKLAYNNELSAALLLKNSKNEFNLIAANLHIGKGEASWPTGPGLFVTGNFDDLNWEKIKVYLDQTTDTSNLPKLPFRGLDVSIDRLSLEKLKMSQLNIKAIPDNNEWEIEVSSPEINGKISLPTPFNREGSITARFDKLHLHSNDAKSANPSFETKNLPSITFIATDASFDNMNLGAVTFKTGLNNIGQSIETLRVFSPRMDLKAKGNWLQMDGNKTTLQGSVVSKHVADLLTSLGFDVHNYVLSTGSVNFNLNWQDTPFAPHLAGLNGSATLQLGQGRIVEVGQASGTKLDIGRMLSIFSLQSLPRRLSLNFSDLFQKGYTFDKIGGDFIFRNGNIYTSNLHFDGPVARVGINGRIGLKNKDYDLIVSITPFVTSTIPLVATLVTLQPLVGLAALAVNSVIDASRVTTYYYAVKGPWSNPIWSSVHG